MSEQKRLHLVGIGGSGMLPLALLLNQAGHKVTGSDSLCPPERLALLAASGIATHSDPDAAHVEATDCVVVSPAIPQTHIERRAARRAGVPLRVRAEVLAELIADRPKVCVAGSHGKSTTTAMLIHLLNAAGRRDFGYMLGGAFTSGDIAPARLGEIAAPFVTESCEAYGALAHWRPDYAILTNVDDDHADHYGGLPGLKQAFAAFASRLPSGARLVACGDDPAIRMILTETGCDALTYGFGEANRLRAAPHGQGHSTIFLNGAELGVLTLTVAGRHNLLNALAALGMALKLGVDFNTAAKALTTFPGIARRLQRVSTNSQIHLIDDFAHHPAEISASIAAVRGTTAGRVITVLEPQLHSRVIQMAAAFAQALSAADYSFILPLAALGETAYGQDGNIALREACLAQRLSCQHVSDRSDLWAQLQKVRQAGDTILVMAGSSGAGIAPWLADALCCPLPPLNAPSLVMGKQHPVPPDLLEVITRRALTDPTAPAAEMGHRSLSYADLLRRAQDLSAVLVAADVKAGDSVGVCLGRSVDRVTSFLAILRIGGVFVPLDPALPEERLRFMLQTAGARRVIVNAASPALPDMGLGFINCGLLPEREAARHIEVHPPPACANSLAYMIFTSGTTGQPKAVEISRGAMVNYALAALDQFGINSQSRVSQINGFGFDTSVGDMVMSLVAGACLVYPTDVMAVPGPPLGRFIAQARLTHVSCTPSALTIIPQADYPALTHVIVAGEACAPALVERWGHTRCFINAYGPTEATIEALFAVCTPGEPVTIGKPIRNMGACVMDESLGLVAPGQEGELCLFGIGLAKAYRDQRELTVARFPMVQLPGLGTVRIYRTGDRVKCRPDGQFVYLGRMDSQLKLKGYRIEPGEVEAAICDLHGVIDAVVSQLSSDHAPDRLIAHLVMAPGMAAPDPAILRERLLQRLPSYMVPQLFLPIPEIPRNANGKRDRTALPLPPSLTKPTKPRTVGTPTEAKIMLLIDDLIGANVVSGIRDSLGDCGVDSLAMANLLFAIEDAFAMTIDTGFEAGLDNVEALALLVDAQRHMPQVLPSAELKDALATKIVPYLATWPGQASGKSGLLRRIAVGPEHLRKLFWCFQAGNELSALSAAMQGQASVFGLRSGHLAVEYTSDNLAALGRLYAEEISAVAPTGVLYLGGNCQGGLVIREAGLELMRQGREIALTIFMEQGRFFHYPAPTLLIFGASSYLNPYGQMGAPDQLFRTAYPAGHQVEIISGSHGHYFSPQNVIVLAAALLRHMSGHGGSNEGFTDKDFAAAPSQQTRNILEAV
ncbi:MAG: hypothetical protein JWS10_1861 [Cypionkella sp.]|uniref:amino acid adenylation domain-containing protein n=1 Tax=Cypionkella sp. TaxID=2811411 RepID=UPI0026374D38|nr:amino acid adenylation domain-containing protein [Cypionkella sp.]MDB5659246.1 hypothetical protein [Cypionkella sp.]